MLPLPPDEVHVWTASRDAPDEVVEAMRSLLDADELKRADRFAFPATAGNSPSAGGCSGRSSAAISTARRSRSGSSPTPTASRGSTRGWALIVPIRFNLAHSGPWVVYALTLGRELGVDIERIRPEFGGFAIAERFFAPGEVAALRALPEESRGLAFFHGWARKEAYIKAKGKGLALPLDEFEVAIDPDRPAALLSTLPDPPRRRGGRSSSSPPSPATSPPSASRGGAGRSAGDDGRGRRSDRRSPFPPVRAPAMMGRGRAALDTDREARPIPCSRPPSPTDPSGLLAARRSP